MKHPTLGRAVAKTIRLRHTRQDKTSQEEEEATMFTSFHALKDKVILLCLQSAKNSALEN